MATTQEKRRAVRDAAERRRKPRSRYLNPDNTFVGGFKGCVAYQMEHEGHSRERAEKICAYIGRRAGKIP